MATVSCLRPTPVLPGSNQPTAGIPELLVPILRELPPPAPFVLPRGVSDFPLRSNLVIYWLATLSRATYSANGTLFTSAVRAVLPPGYPVTFVPNQAVPNPGYGIIKMPLALIVVISGTTNLGQWQDQIFSGSPVPLDIFGDNSTDKSQTMASYKSAADAINTAINAASTSLPVLLVGHSMGGAVAECLHYRYCHGTDPRPPSRCVTFGAPKPGNAYMVRNMRTGQQVFRRVMISGDPVPALPPDLSALRALAPPPFRGVASSWDKYQQPGQAYYLNNQGLLNPGDEPFLPTLMIGAMLQAALGNPLAIVDAHRPRTFVNYLRNGFMSFDDPVTRYWGNAATLNVVNGALTAEGV